MTLDNRYEISKLTNELVSAKIQVLLIYTNYI